MFQNVHVYQGCEKNNLEKIILKYLAGNNFVEGMRNINN
jgi:hypothetical protein